MKGLYAAADEKNRERGLIRQSLQSAGWRRRSIESSVGFIITEGRSTTLVSGSSAVGWGYADAWAPQDQL